jgi:signal transduction histidine kinase
MNFFTLYTIPPLLSSILFLLLGVSVYWNNRKSIVNKTFLSVCFVTFWWQFSWFILFNIQSEVVANYFVKIGYIGIIFIPIFFFHFFLSFLPKISKFDKYLLYFSYFLGLIFEIALFTTNYFISGFYKYFWGFYPKANFLHIIYLLLLAILTSRVIYLLFYYLGKKKEVSPDYYYQTKFMLWALLFYVPASSDFIINYGKEFYPFGFLFILIFLGITAYAITKHRLFGIKVLLTEVLVIATALALLVQALTAPQTILKILGLALLVFFSIFGYQLVRSVIREIELRAKLEVLYGELKKLDDAKSEFISIASHQLRTPLTAVKGYVSMILENSYGDIPKEMDQPLKNVYASNERLIKLVNDILNISKIEAGKMEMEWEKASLEEMILDIINELKVKADTKKLYLKYEKPEIPVPAITIDKTKIRQVILNIIDNSIKYTEHGGTTVKIQNLKSKVQIIVSDTGIGLEKSDIPRLFESFSRGRNGSIGRAEGTGLGLYIARRFIEMHQGKIWVESEGKGKGSRFFIELPIRE